MFWFFGSETFFSLKTPLHLIWKNPKAWLKRSIPILSNATLTPKPWKINLTIIWKTFIFVPGLNTIKKKTTNKCRVCKWTQKESLFHAALGAKNPFCFLGFQQRPKPPFQKQGTIWPLQREVTASYEGKALKRMLWIMNKPGATATRLPDLKQLLAPYAGKYQFAAGTWHCLWTWLTKTSTWLPVCARAPCL